MKKYVIENIDDLPMMNFSIIHIMGRQPYYDWMNSLEDEFTIDRENDFDAGISFMVHEDWLEEEVKKFIKLNFQEIFEYMLFEWHTDEAAWPKNISFKMFCEWFEWRYSGMIIRTPSV